MDASLHRHIRYLTNSGGEPTDVLVPIDIWEQLISTLREQESGLAWIDEREPTSQLLEDLRSSLKEAVSQQTAPIAQLWQDIEA
ncbi:MAG: hypothetical protein AAFX40_13170 [Cyanobacteria bacterium J06639_1]